MSTDWDVWCLDCEKAHGFYDANHMSDLMIGLAKLGPALGAFAKTMREIGSIQGSDPSLPLQFDRLRVNFEWFEVHGSHRLIARDEYGRCFDECGEHYSYCECKHQRRCRRPMKHEGLHAEERDK